MKIVKPSVVSGNIYLILNMGIPHTREGGLMVFSPTAPSVCRIPHTREGGLENK